MVLYIPIYIFDIDLHWISVFNKPVAAKTNIRGWGWREEKRSYDEDIKEKAEEADIEAEGGGAPNKLWNWDGDGVGR